MTWLLTLSLAAAADLPGTYAMQLRVASSARAPLFGETVSWTDTLLSVSIEEVDGRLWLEQRPCSVEVFDALPIADTLIPEAFVSALPSRRYAIELGADAAFSADMGRDAVGYNPNRSAGSVPDHRDAPGVFDWDGDGQPGATVRIAVPLFGEVGVYVVQGSQAELSGKVLPSGEIRGGVHVAYLEQHVIGAERKMFHVSPVLSPHDEASGFRLRPVTPETGCAEIIAGREWLFGPEPELEESGS